MTTPTPNPYQPAAPATLRAPVDRWRWLLAGVIGILGGYLTVASIVGPLLQALGPAGASYGPEFLVQFVLQLVFALAVTVFAYVVAVPGNTTGKIVASLVYVLGVAAVFAILWGRLFGSLRLGIATNFIVNPYFLVLLLGALGWLIAVRARGLAYLALLLTFVVMPLNGLLIVAGVSSSIAVTVQYLACLLVAGVVLAVSRPRPPVTAAPLAPSPFLERDEATVHPEPPAPV